MAVPRDQRPPIATGTIAALAIASLALHAAVLAVTTFGIHRDEFLYFSMGNHLRLWHMDFPPAIAMLGAVSQFLFGHTVAAARIFPAVEGTVLVVLTALFARELGGGRFAQGFAALCVLASPLYLRSSTQFQPVVLDQICWTLALLAIARVARAQVEAGDRRSAWLSFGVAIGLGLLCKFSILFLCVSVLAAVLITAMRRELLTPWPWIAVLIMLVIGSPSVVGQITLGYPVVAQMRALDAGQLQHVTPAEYFSTQLLFLGPVGLLVVIAGTIAMFVSHQLRRYAAVSLSCIVAFLLLLVLHGKAYYIGPIYPALFSAGAVVLDRMNSQRARPIVSAVQWSAVAFTVAFSLIALPMSLPILSVAATARYAARFAGGVALRTNHGTVDQLPQDFADMLGWRDEATALASAYRSLSPAEQREAVIVAGNYGQAGAAEFYAAEFRLPPVVSTAGSFWFFGPGKLPGAVVISLGADVRDLRKFWSSVTEVSRLERPRSVAEERDEPIYVSRGPRTTLQALWPGQAGRN